jgi:hypothetical protein
MNGDEIMRRKTARKIPEKKKTYQNSDYIYGPDNYYIMNDTVYFKLFGRASDTYASVSIDKWLVVSQYKWYLGKNDYPCCYELYKTTLHKFVFRMITGCKIPSDIYIDHIDRNKLNNTNTNLRMVSPQENSFNKSSKSNKKGVRKISENNYTASITKNGTKHEIKNIKTEKEAAEMYNIMAEELFGVHAAFNDVNKL